MAWFPEWSVGTCGKTAKALYWHWFSFSDRFWRQTKLAMEEKIQIAWKNNDYVYKYFVFLELQFIHLFTCVSFCLYVFRSIGGIAEKEQSWGKITLLALDNVGLSESQLKFWSYSIAKIAANVQNGFCSESLSHPVKSFSPERYLNIYVLSIWSVSLLSSWPIVVN